MFGVFAPHFAKLPGKPIEMMKPLLPGVIALVLVVSCFHSAGAYANGGFDPLAKLMMSRPRTRELTPEPVELSPVYLAAADQIGLMEADKIEKLPGQPDGVDFDQYSGYVTVDANAGRALFYYFTEAPTDAASKPLVLWLNGGPGCSSFGNGAMMELGPFRVNSDGKTLWRNEFAWNNVANILFLESPAGVGFSYSNKTSDYDLSGDERTAQDSYTFLLNWLQRFPQYKNRDFYIAGESYAGHYVPQLAYKILLNNDNNNSTTNINLRGIAIGNAWIDDVTNSKGMYDYFWTHALISDQLYQEIRRNCSFYRHDAGGQNSSSSSSTSDPCSGYFGEALDSMGDIFIYDIYAPLCNSSARQTTRTMGGFDPCSDDYIASYLNLPEVQEALHVSSVPRLWESCNLSITRRWTDSPPTILPTIQLLMETNLSIWIYSGDTDGRVPVTSSKYSVDAFNLSTNTPWYPWYTNGEVGGHAIGYDKNLALVTVRGAGHFVPSYQPARALALFTSFLQGKLPPS